MLVGAHVSTQGGVENAPQNGKNLGCEAIQIFSKNQMQWAAPALKPESVEGFKAGVKGFGFGPTLIHASYLLNCASQDDALWEKSWRGLVVELERADALGIPWVVFHPGSPKDKGAEWGVTRVAAAVTEALAATKSLKSGILLETNAGQGAAVGRTFEELAGMIQGVASAERGRVGVCVDTCHVFVAGYPIHTEEGFEETFGKFADTVGLDRLKAFHVNDSKAEFGSNRDRHENLGKGLMGDVPFWKLMTDKRFEKIPGYCETPGGDEGYVEDLKRLRGFREGKLKPKAAPKKGQQTLGGDVVPSGAAKPKAAPRKKR
jgi:deoxyribonuclease-4